MKSCSHKLSQNKLPKGIRPNECEREIWPKADDDHCILHTKQKVENIEKLEAAIANSERIDGLQLARQKLSNGFTFHKIQIYGGDFQNAELAGCKFQNTDIFYTRFEGAVLKNAKFGSVEEPEGKVNVRIKIRNNNFEGADLSDATFRQVSLLNSKFDCEDMRAVDFLDCSLPSVIFKEQDLRDSDFSYSVLRDSSFIKCRFHNSKFNASVLTESKFIGSNLRNTDFRNSILHETEFRNVHLDHRTKFDSLLVQEYLADLYSEENLSAAEVSDAHEYLHSKRESIPISFGEQISSRGLLQRISHASKRFKSRWGGTKDDPDYSPLEHARYRYRDLSRIFGENDEPERARKYSVHEKHARRKNALRTNKWGWAWLSLTRWTMKYGDEPVQPLKAALVVALVSAIFYPLLGLKYVDSGQSICYCLHGEPSLNAFISIIHLSLVRILSPTNPSVRPVGFGVALGLFESLAGTLLTAMFVFTLGRRATE